MTDLKVPGFRISVAAADVRGRGGGRPDMGLILCDRDASAAGVFTRNRMAAAPVILCRERLAGGRARAVLVNSGNANCMSGAQGMADAMRLTAFLAGRLHLPEGSVLMCSTGVIGQRLPVERMEKALQGMIDGLDEAGMEALSRAIMTTDTRPKVARADLTLSGGRAVIAGVAKGAGMIAPDMATMLAFLLTDASLQPTDLAASLEQAVSGTFNTITVDGDTSTNDTVLLMASGAGPTVSSLADRQSFVRALEEVCLSLAEQIVADGEGAKRVVQIQVNGAVSDGEARAAARAVADSLLVKTALAAADPNWGRIAAAIGYSGAETAPERMSLSIGEVEVLVRGEVPEGYDEARAAEVMRSGRYSLYISIGDGPGSARVLTCDLTEEYVRINAEYRS